MRGAGRGHRPRSRWLVSGVAIAIIVIACTTVPPAPTPSPTEASPPVGETPEVTPHPTSGGSDTTLVVRATSLSTFGLLVNQMLPDDQLAHALVMSALYRFDDQLEPVPDLAAEECTVSADGLTFTCRLRDAQFHNGTRLTADDVVFTYELQSACAAIGDERCPAMIDLGIAPFIESVRELNDRTVEFRLSAPNATFRGDVLPREVIVSRRVYEETFDELATAARRLPQDAAEKLRAAVQEIAGDEAVCARLRDDIEGLAADVMASRDRLREFLPRMRDDVCLEALITAEFALQAISASEMDGLTALATAYFPLALRAPRVGTGPWRVVRDEPGRVVEFQAHEGYHHGRPAIDRIVMRTIPDADVAGELRRGTLHLVMPSSEETYARLYDELRDDPGIRIARLPELGYLALQYNVRPGRLFSELKLRKAMQLCLDKTNLVDAATAGTGIPLEGPLLPLHWAYRDGLSAPERDVEAARALIESAGWKLGDDDVYVKDGDRLSADIWVRAVDDRVRFATVIAERARQCGMELTVQTAPFVPDLSEMVTDAPHRVPGGEDPFELYVGGYGTFPDPHDTFDPFHSRNIPTEEQPGGSNFIGYHNEVVDRKIDEARVTYGQHERARLYQDVQGILDDEQPYLFGWAFRSPIYMTDQLQSLAGPLNLESPLWFWQLDKLTLAPSR